MAHPFLVWMPAEMRDSWNRTLKSLKTSKLSLTGLSLMVLVPLPGTKTALMLSLCALSQADPHTLIVLRSFLKTGTFILLVFLFCPGTNPFPSLEAAIAQQNNTKTRLKKRSLKNPNRNNKGTSGGGVAGRVVEESRRRRVRTSRNMVDNPPMIPISCVSGFLLGQLSLVQD
eukprot:1161229-Pelagomonas_calceolata.AAC.9